MKLAKGYLARNKLTGLYWDGFGFRADEYAAAVLDAPELALLRATWENVESICLGVYY